MERILKIVGVVPREGRLWLMAAAALLGTGWVKGINLLMLLAYLMLCLLVVNAVVARRQGRRLRGRRVPLGPLFAGQTGTWDVELTSTGRAAAGWRAVDRGPNHRLEWFYDRLERGETVRFRASAVPAKRGRYALQPLTVECPYPFGLVRWPRQVGPAESWVVLPPVGRLDAAGFRRWLERAARGDGRLHRVARPSMIHQDDLYGLRPFRPGDSPRWIHWRTSARRNEKMVREFEEASGQNLILIVDPGRSGAGGAELEALLSLAATICWEWATHNFDQLFLLVAGAEPEVVSGYCSRDKAVTMLRSLALVEVGRAATPDVVFKAIARRVVPDAPVVLLSPDTAPPLAGRVAAAWNRPVLRLTTAAAAEFYSAPRPPVAPAPVAAR